jgi:transcriptional regulator with XRE-family HTH domain
MAQRVPTRSTKEERHIGAIFARRLREARNARGWTQQELAAALGRLSAPMDRTTVAKIEKGQREVRLDEFVAFAAALDIAPVHLILPIEGDVVVRYIDRKREALRNEKRGPAVRLAPALLVDQVKARRWARGEIPLDPANFRFYRDQGAGERSVSAEELSPDEQQAVREENERLLRKLGVQVINEPAEQAPPTKRSRSTAADEKGN